MFRTFLATALLLLTGCAPAEETGPVVLAASSMTEAIEAAADAWEAQGHLRPVLSFAGSASVARQVEQGAPADMVIVADAEWMDWLAERDLVDATTRRVIAGNSLVLVTADSRAMPDSIDAAMQGLGDDRLALADPDGIPAGRYARAALTRMGLWDEVADQVVPAENVRAALALVERGEARYGVIYGSDALVAEGLTGQIGFDFRDVPEITYPAALLNRSGHPDAAGFLEFLTSPAGMDVFAAHGFVPYEQAP